MTQRLEYQRSPFWAWLLFIGVICFCLYMVRGILLPFIAGLLVAYAMTPAVRGMERWKISRGIGTLIMITGFVLVIVSFFFVAIPLIQNELLRLAKDIPNYGQQLVEFIQPYLQDLELYIAPADIEKLRQMTSSYLVDMLSWGLRALAGVLTSSLAIANLISLIFITPIVAFYFLRDWNRILSVLDQALPQAYAPTIRRVVCNINETIGGFAKGQGTVCVVLGLYYATLLSLVGLKYGLLVGLVIGLISFIPYVGAICGFFLSMGLALAQFDNWSSIALVASIFAVGQILEGYLLVPKLVGDRIGLHPLWVIFAILAGGILYGFVGILIALPVAAAVGVLIRFAIEKYKESSYYLASPKNKKTTKKQ